MQTLTRPRALFELVFAGALWGFGFIAVRWGLEGFGPYWVNALRFALSFIAGVPLFYLIVGRRARLWADFKLSRNAGLWLGISLILQAIGLQYTSVTKSGFITCLYVVFVPPIGRLFYGTRTRLAHYFWVFVALVGAALICELTSLKANLGDFLTLLCALAVALQILEVDRAAPKAASGFGYTLHQCLWAGMIPLVGALLLETFPGTEPPAIALVGIAVLAFGSSLLAFTIQVRTQKVLSPAIVSLLFLLESPFAAFFAFWFFGESFTLTQMVGGGLILFAASFSILGPRAK